MPVVNIQIKNIKKRFYNLFFFSQHRKDTKELKGNEKYPYLWEMFSSKLSVIISDIFPGKRSNQKYQQDNQINHNRFSSAHTNHYIGTATATAYISYTCTHSYSSQHRHLKIPVSKFFLFAFSTLIRPATCMHTSQNV